MNSILKDWSFALSDAGFQFNDSRLIRAIGPIQHSITLQRSRTAEPGRIRINLFISILDRFLENPTSIICLAGHVSAQSAGFSEYEAWWCEEELVKSGLGSLKEFGLAWLETLGKDALILSKWLERAVEYGCSVQEFVETRGRSHPEIEALIKPQLSEQASSAPRDYDRFLSLLKYEQGNILDACKYAQRYLRTCQLLEGVFSEEPERTVRQLRVLKCHDF